MHGREELIEVPVVSPATQIVLKGLFMVFSCLFKENTRSGLTFMSWMLTVWWLHCRFYWYFYLSVGLQMITGLLYNKLTPGWLKTNVMMQIRVPSSWGPSIRRVQGRKPLCTCWISGAWTLLWWAECEKNPKIIQVITNTHQISEGLCGLSKFLLFSLPPRLFLT